MLIKCDNSFGYLWKEKKKSCISSALGFAAASLRLHHETQHVSPRDGGLNRRYTHPVHSNASGAGLPLLAAAIDNRGLYNTKINNNLATYQSNYY